MLFNLNKCFEVDQSKLVLFAIIRVLRVRDCGAANYLLFELVTSHASIRAGIFITNVTREKNTGVLSNSLSGVNVVTSAHANSHSGFAALSNCFLDTSTEGIFQAIDTDHGKILLQDFLIFDALEIIMILA